ncbi:hypothetical protein Sm713_26610 [Streptomyces sp. TS71-3]|nr:hypothetical protein Sm713_26610 [Streptomyces sp. TS71-3]
MAAVQGLGPDPTGSVADGKNTAASLSRSVPDPFPCVTGAVVPVTGRAPRNGRLGPAPAAVTGSARGAGAMASGSRHVGKAVTWYAARAGSMGEPNGMSGR